MLQATLASSTSGAPWLWIALIVGGLVAGASALVLGRARGRREGAGAGRS